MRGDELEPTYARQEAASEVCVGVDLPLPRGDTHVALVHPEEDGLQQKFYVRNYLPYRNEVLCFQQNTTENIG